MNRLNPGLAGLRQKRSHPACKIDIGRQHHILFMTERWQIHCVLYHAQFQILAHLPRYLNAHSFLRLACRSGDVRSQNHIVQLEIRRVFQRLHGKNIQRCASHLSALQCSHQRCVFYQFAARAIDNAHTLFHRRQRLRIDYTRRLRCQSHV